MRPARPRAIPASRRTGLRRLVAVGAALWVCAAPAAAHAATPRLVPLADAAQSRAPAAAPGETRAPAARARALARVLRETVRVLRARAAARGAPLSESQRDALEKLRARVGAGLTIHTRERVATPRSLRGRVLEPAATARAGGDADLATARSFLRRNRGLLRLDDPDAELSLRRRWRDRLGRRHLRFEQRHRGLRVWPAELTVHLDGQGRVDALNGLFVPTPRKVATAPRIGRAEAVRRARAAVPGDRARAATAREAELVVLATGQSPPRLAWRVELPVSPADDWLALIDARGGQTLLAYDRVATTAVAGRGIDLFGTTRDLSVWSEGGFFLVDASKTMFDPGSDPPAPASTRGAITILDSQNTPPTSEPQTLGNPVVVQSGSPDSGWLPDGVSAAHNFSQTYDYFEQRHGRLSLDDAGASILAFVRLGVSFPNAFFNQEGGYMAFGDAVPFAGALDVVAHELTHGVTFHSAGLEYVNQSGALNEAFSDIFGEAAELFATGSVDWINGSAIPDPGNRNLMDPSSVEICCGRFYPERMSELIQPDDPFLDNFAGRDNGGVHLNSSIVNHAFYQLAAGLPGAIGIADAEAIFYRALTVHLVRFSQFIDARLGCVLAAEELYGAGSPQAQRTAEAFDFVEIFDAPPTPAPDPFPGVADAEDATLFLFADPDFPTLDLGRRETALGDGALGVGLSAFVAPARPAVRGDGSLAAFVASNNDLCLIDTETGAEACLSDDPMFDFTGMVASAGMSPSGDLFGFVFQDPITQEREGRILVIDLSAPEGESVRDIRLVAPALDGGVVTTVIRADVLDFTADDAFLVYDALNEVRFASGAPVQHWSIYAVDLETGQTLAVLPPMPGLDIAFPALSQTSDRFLTFDVFDGGGSTIYAGDLDTGDLEVVGAVPGNFGVPSYAGDDRAIVYSQIDAQQPTGFSLLRQPLAPDRLTPQGGPTLWLADADFGTIYRRGTFVPEPPPGPGALAALATLLGLARLRRRRRRDDAAKREVDSR